MKQSVILIGAPGSGKSVTGRVLADRLSWLLVDTDAEVVAKTKLPISDIFASFGEEYFRNLETKVILDLVEQSPQRSLVVSCGGGLAVREQNYRLLESLGTIVCLAAEVHVLAKRIGTGAARPLLHGESAAKVVPQLLDLLSQRAPTYNRPRYRIDTTDLTPQEACEQIISLLGLV